MFSPGKIYKPDGISVRKSPLHGQGVFAKRNFEPGEIIEIAPVILLKNEERDSLQHTYLFSYYFLIDHKETPVALGLGFSSLYNHAPDANAVYSLSVKKARIIVRARNQINAGEEITLNYNGTPDDNTPVYFPPDNNL